MIATRLLPVLALGLCLGFAPAARGQKAGGLPAELKALEPLVGKWDVTIRYRIGPDKFAEGKATCESAWILDGRVLRQEYASTFGGKPFTVLQFLGYDEQKKRFYELRMDNREGGVMHNEGTLSADGLTLTQAGPKTDPATGREGRLRTVTTMPKDGRYSLE